MGALYWRLTIDERDGCFEDLVFVVKCLYSEYDLWIIGRIDPANSLLRDNPCSDERSWHLLREIDPLRPIFERCVQNG